MAERWKFCYQSTLRPHFSKFPRISLAQTTTNHWISFRFFSQRRHPPIEIPMSKLEISFSRSSGPGGQNVNKVNSKVEVSKNRHKFHFFGRSCDGHIWIYFPDSLSF